MSILATVTTLAQGGKPGHSADVSGEGWDLERFFNNATSYTQTIGGAFLALVGIFGIAWGGFLLVRKLLGGQQAQQDSWFKVVMLIIVGGAMLFGGMTILLKFAKGSNKTITNFGENGGGLILSAGEHLNSLAFNATEALSHIPVLTSGALSF